MTHNLKLAIFGFLMLGVFSLQAQPPITIDSTQTGERMTADTFPKAEQATAMMAEKLSLTDAQRLKVNDINMRYQTRHHLMVDSFSRVNGDQGVYDGRIRTMRQEQDAELKAVLTADQWNTWDKWQAEERKMRGEQKKDWKNEKNQPNQPPQPSQPAKPGKPNQPNQPGKPNQQNQPNQPAKPDPTSPMPAQTAPPKGGG